MFKPLIQTSSSCRPCQPYPQRSYASLPLIPYPKIIHERISRLKIIFEIITLASMGFCIAIVCAHLLLDLFLDLFEVGSQVQRHLVFGAQQSLQHGVSRHAYFLKSGFLEFTYQVLNLYLQIVNLKNTHCVICWKSSPWRINKSENRIHAFKTSFSLLATLRDRSYLSSSTTSVFWWSSLHRSWP